MNKVLFTESQVFNQWWLWLILLFYIALMTVVFIVFLKIRPGVIPGALRKITLCIIVVIVIAPVALFLSLRLETQVKTDGVYVRFLPFTREFNAYRWNVMAKCYIRQYDPIAEYGGWGFRQGDNGKALNVSGNTGLQLKLTDGTKLLIGTNKPEQMRAAIASVNQLKE